MTGNPPTGESDPAAIDWAACLSLHEGWLRTVILARTGERQAVDEVYQQVALAALQQRAPLRDAAKAAPWLHRLAVVHSARYRRKLGRQRRVVRGAGERLLSLGNGYAEDALAWLVDRERHERTRQALARLPAGDAEILSLKYGERWTYRQIAERLGISEKAADARLLRARGRLRRQLLELGIDSERP